MTSHFESSSVEALRKLSRTGGSAPELQSKLDAAVKDAIEELSAVVFSRLPPAAARHAGACLFAGMTAIFNALRRKMKADILGAGHGEARHSSPSTDRFVAGQLSFVAYFGEMIGDVRGGPIREVLGGAEDRAAARKHPQLTLRREAETGQEESLDDAIDRRVAASGEQATSGPESDLAAEQDCTALHAALRQIDWELRLVLALRFDLLGASEVFKLRHANRPAEASDAEAASAALAAWLGNLAIPKRAASRIVERYRTMYLEVRRNLQSAQLAGNDFVILNGDIARMLDKSDGQITQLDRKGRDKLRELLRGSDADRAAAAP